MYCEPYLRTHNSLDLVCHKISELNIDHCDQHPYCNRVEQKYLYLTKKKKKGLIKSVKPGRKIYYKPKQRL